ncbi:MAG: sigma-54 dependent transcriptional regulator [Acidobacteriota bacterium]
MALILVVDDEAGIREMVRAVLGADGHEVVVAASGDEAVRRIAEDTPDLVLTDLAMPGMSGIELLRHLSEDHPDVPSIVITAYGSKESAVEAMRHGAVNYVEKPFDVEELRLHVRRALRHRSLTDENRELRVRLSVEREIVGRNPAIAAIRDLVARIAPTDSTVLITGESGTGKEVVARSIHRASARADQPFVGINCAAIPAELLESEMFGHERGAFTGADTARRGLVETAHGGTLFLDEIGDMPMAMQVKLLRFLQERRIRRVGGNREIPVDVRVLTATHQDLPELVRAGRFREDLYYRIHVIEIRMPPLRERREDIPEFVRFFAGRHAARMGRPEPAIDPQVLDALSTYSWPGNIRELENVVERAVALASGDRLTPDTLPAEVLASARGPGARVQIPAGFDLDGHLEEERRRYMEAALELTGGVQKRAAELLGMTFRSFRYFARKFGLTAPRGGDPETPVAPGPGGGAPPPGAE